MKAFLKHLACVWCCVLFIDAAPLDNYETTEAQAQACGDQLADLISLVCSARGFNNPFKKDHSSARRFRRQIVEECCKKSCTPAMLELYCSAEPTEAPTVTPIRKRSDSDFQSGEVLQKEDLIKRSTEQSQQPLASRTQINFNENKESTSSTTTKKANVNYKLINLLEPSDNRPMYKHKTRNNKSTQNDTTEEEFDIQSAFPALRHRQHYMRQMRNHKAFGKAKGEKKSSDERKQTFQIGTVKPFFARRTPDSYRSNYIHQAPTTRF